jgi:hypothetical protein
MLEPIIPLRSTHHDFVGPALRVHAAIGSGGHDRREIEIDRRQTGFGLEKNKDEQAMAPLDHPRYRTAPLCSSRGSRLSAPSSGQRRCQGRMAMAVPAWRLIFQAR